MNLNWANRITILRILLIVPFVSCMLKINAPAFDELSRHIFRYAAFTIFMAMAVSDAADGYLARRKGGITRLGSFLDPTADKLLITSACLLLASRHTGIPGFNLPPTVVVLIIGKDILLLIGFVILYLITGQIRLEPVFMGKLATTLQLSMVAAILISPEISRVIPPWIWFVRFLWWASAISAIAATLVYIRNGNRYIEQYEESTE